MSFTVAGSIRVFYADGPCPYVSLLIRTRVSLSLFPVYHLLFGSRPRWSRLVPPRKRIITRQRMSKETQGHGLSTQKTQMEPATVKDTNMYMYKRMTKYKRNRRSVTTEQAGEQMPMPAFLRTKETRWRCCRKHTGVPRNSVSLPKTCTKEAMENGG